MWKRSSLLSLLLALAPLFGFGQVPSQVDSVVYPGGSSLALTLLPPESEQVEAARLADRDIAAGHMFLLLHGGIAPSVYETDPAFNKKYGVSYWDEGCTSSGFATVSAYNRRVFIYLSGKYGRSWLKEIRVDVIGLQEWKKARHRS